MEHKENTEKQAVFVDALMSVLGSDSDLAEPSQTPLGTQPARHDPFQSANFGRNCQVFYISGLNGPTSFTFHPGSPPQVAPPAPAAPARPWHFVVACLGVAALAASLLMHLH